MTTELFEQQENREQLNNDSHGPKDNLVFLQILQIKGMLITRTKFKVVGIYLKYILFQKYKFLQKYSC